MRTARYGQSRTKYLRFNTLPRRKNLPLGEEVRLGLLYLGLESFAHLHRVTFSKVYYVDDPIYGERIYNA